LPVDQAGASESLGGKQMFRTTRKLVLSLSVLCLAALGLIIIAKSTATDASTATVAGSRAGSSRRLASQPAATFGGANLGAIPDAATGNCWGAFVPTPRNVTFNVTGIGGAPTNVEVSATFGGPAHTWVGDVRATLIAPNAASHVVFARTGGTTSGASGDSSDLAGPYNFKDSAAGVNWWTEAANRLSTEALTAGDYRTTTAGGAAGGGTNTSMTPAFAGVADPNGTWTLRLEDGCAGDSGSISAATLTIEGGPTGPAAAPNVDFDGDGTSDAVIARDATPPPLQGAANDFFRAESVREKLRLQQDMAAPEGVPGGAGTTLEWWVNNSLTSTAETVRFGASATDFLVPNDYDGDGQADYAIWRPGVATDAGFIVFQSSNSTIVVTPFGQTGDDAAITGDYDGDLKADYATYRCPGIGTGDGQCFFFYRGSMNNPGGNITYVPWGFGEQFDFFVNPGDFDGDGKFDFCVQRTHPSSPGNGQFVLLRSSDGGVEYVNWGRNSDLIIPGDYDGDGKYDFCISRTETLGGVPGRSYYILERDGGGTGLSPIRWGIASDVRTPGDYDGDGITDIAIWRPSVTQGQSRYWVRRSSDGMAQQIVWGQNGDFAVAGWIVH
jgi:hypothetical protein